MSNNTLDSPDAAATKADVISAFLTLDTVIDLGKSLSNNPAITALAEKASGFRAALAGATTIGEATAIANEAVNAFSAHGGESSSSSESSGAEGLGGCNDDACGHGCGESESMNITDLLNRMMREYTREVHSTSSSWLTSELKEKIAAARASVSGKPSAHTKFSNERLFQNFRNRIQNAITQGNRSVQGLTTDVGEGGCAYLKTPSLFGANTSVVCELVEKNKDDFSDNDTYFVGVYWY